MSVFQSATLSVWPVEALSASSGSWAAMTVWSETLGERLWMCATMAAKKGASQAIRCATVMVDGVRPQISQGAPAPGTPKLMGASRMVRPCAAMYAIMAS